MERAPAPDTAPRPRNNSAHATDRSRPAGPRRVAATLTFALAFAATAAAPPAGAQEVAAPAAPAEATETSPADPHEAVRKEIETLRIEQEKITAEIALADAKLKQELAEMRREQERLAAERSLREAQLEAELAPLKEEETRLRQANALAAARAAARMEELKVQDKELMSEKLKLDHDVARLTAALAKRQKEDEWANYVDRDPDYMKEPLKGKTLVVSDRRIALNGVITSTTADHVAERINFFNNKSTEFPIFIVIDSSPGGSVMAGYKILEAMEGSEAPVYTVVKSYAASMAAAICTLSERSYAYPNAVLLHHQMSYGWSGNMTVQKEQLEIAQEWARRLSEPIAKKMGITLEQFTKRMYQSNSEGDWEEFADVAQRLKWVDTTVDDIKETSLLRHPDARVPAPPVPRSWEVEKTDAQGRAYVSLPRLSPRDFYYLYNPDGYYRVHP